MNIKTKFDIGYTIVFLRETKVLNTTVRGIKIEVRGEETEITYLCSQEPTQNIQIKVLEQNAFKNKEELIKSL